MQSGSNAAFNNALFLTPVQLLYSMVLEALESTRTCHGNVSISLSSERLSCGQSRNISIMIMTDRATLDSGLPLWDEELATPRGASICC